MAWKLPFFKNKKYRPRQPQSPRRYIQLSGGSVVSPDSAKEVSAFYRGLTYISTQISKIPWEIKDADNKLVNNSLSNLLQVAPNPEVNAFHFKNCMVQWAIIFGNSYAEIVRDLRGMPTQLWLMDPRDVQPWRDPDGNLIYRIIGGSAAYPGQDAYLAKEDVFHLKNFITSDNGVMGQGVVSYATTTLGISLGADQFANGLFSNGGMPSGVIEVGGSLSDEAFKRIKESWQEAHGGRKAGGTAVLEEGAKFEPVSLAPDVLQFLETRKFSVFEIARFLGVPPTKLFDGDSATYNNIEHANLEVATDTLDAWARNLECEADVKLLNNRRGGRKTEFDMYAVFRGDMETRSQYFNRMMQNAAMTPNEIRQKEGMSPYEGGERFFIATNNFSPADRIDEIVDSQINKVKESTEQDDLNEEEEKELRAVVKDFLLSKSK